MVNKESNSISKGSSYQSSSSVKASVPIICSTLSNKELPPNSQNIIIQLPIEQ